MGRPKRNILAAAEAASTPPEALEANQTLVRVVKPEGNNLFNCELPNQKTVVLELAQRFRNTIWIKRGGFVLAEMYTAGVEETRAEGEIVNIVRDEKQWRKQPYWWAHLARRPVTQTLTNIMCNRPKEFSKSAFDMSDEEDDSNVGKMPPSDSDRE
ncbi:hypothetical protein S7711_05534 [Stachybotrys chartarum IBT 7711]|uniref:S1-like domain-containing protein n=1 Tax=Stachybotrys chartarum (strain CBS 109288 / IBT 7711) TaxID=1280523 RepID=A0A084AS46_STACB|nr:hypothetical protein S7711_05534 [Stachybotrys chartarum IBT 7711]KFA53431.1 hypothetical protein S40293_03436 [Stachybotrys chartarum IBT 40293]KFA76009.1 hypothetical protein S40288_00377 [Stachybotrys chartarum IBT 40288]